MSKYVTVEELRARFGVGFVGVDRARPGEFDETVLLDYEPDPRKVLDAAHGEGWAAGTPRTEAEARAMLREVEPPEAVIERRGWQKPRREFIEQWRDSWRQRSVPALTTLVPRCEASACKLVLPDARDTGDATAEIFEAVRDRYGESTHRVLWRWVFEDARRYARELDLLLATNADPMLPLRALRSGVPSEGALMLPGDHAGPHGVPRGWCPMLNPGLIEAESELRPTPVRLAFL